MLVLLQVFSNSSCWYGYKYSINRFVGTVTSTLEVFLLVLFQVLSNSFYWYCYKHSLTPFVGTVKSIL